MEMKNKMYIIFHNVHHFSNFSDFVNLTPCPFLTSLEILLLQIRSKHILDLEEVAGLPYTNNKRTHGPAGTEMTSVPYRDYFLLKWLRCKRFAELY